MQPAQVLSPLRDIAVRGLPTPNDLVQIMVGSEDFVQDEFCVMRDILPNMHINRSLIREQIVEENYRLVEPLQIRIETTPPRVTICLLFNDRRLLREGRGFVFRSSGMVGDGGSKGKIRSRIERRVYVNKVDFARQFRQE